MENCGINHPAPEAGIAYLIHNNYCRVCRVDCPKALATMRAAKQNL